MIVHANLKFVLSKKNVSHKFAYSVKDFPKNFEFKKICINYLRVDRQTRAPNIMEISRYSHATFVLITIRKIFPQTKTVFPNNFQIFPRTFFRLIETKVP